VSPPLTRDVDVLQAGVPDLLAHGGVEPREPDDGGQVAGIRERERHPGRECLERGLERVRVQDGHHVVDDERPIGQRPHALHLLA
jgi:hypothetical protein